MSVRRAAVVLVWCVGCGASEIQGSVSEGRDASVGHTCDPSILADASADDVATSTDGPFVVELAVASQLHQCARMSDGTVRCRGANDLGQLGLGTSGTPSRDAVTVPGLSDVEQVLTVNISVTCTRHRDGTVRCWGSNEFDMLGTGHDGDERCAFSRRSPCRTRPTLVPGLTDVVQLAASMFSVCAVRRDGSVWCWGSVSQLLPRGGSPTPVRSTEFDDVTALWERTFGWVARFRSGRYAMRFSLDPVDIPSSAEIAEGDDSHLCYRLPDGSVRCLGLNADGKIGNGMSLFPGAVTAPWDPGLCGVRSIVTGAYHTCAVLADRTVACWGDDSYDSLGVDTSEQCVGISHATNCATRPTTVPGLDHVDRLFAGVWGTCALRTDRSVWCWGSLAGPPSTSTPTPVVW